MKRPAKEVREMLDKDEKKLVDAFYQDLEFGTGGLRGIMGARNKQDEYLHSGHGYSGFVKLYKFSSAKYRGKSRNCSRLQKTTAGIFAETTANIFLQTDLKFIF